MSRTDNLRVELRPLDRTNFRQMLALKVRPGQEQFVAPSAKSIAVSYVRLFGDNFEYAPMVICDGARVVGYVTAACDSNSTDDYWIDDIMIDAAEQGKGYGRAAVCATVRMILARYPRCRSVRLTCHRRNDVAASLYRSIGFRDTGRLNPQEQQPEFQLAGAALDAYR
jgi:RimJ/RimL family protein N-acetyltransferase